MQLVQNFYKYVLFTEICNLFNPVAAIRKGRYPYSVKYEYFKKTTQEIVDNHGLDEEGNSTNNRTSSESSENGNQTQDCDDIVALSIHKELQDLTASDASPLSLDTNEPSCSSESEELSAPLSLSPEDSPLETCTIADSSVQHGVTKPHDSPPQVVTQGVADELTPDEGTNRFIVQHHRPAPHRSDAMYTEPNTALDDVEKLASRLSAMFISCGTFTPGFFERIRDIEQCYVVSKAALVTSCCFVLYKNHLHITSIGSVVQWIKHLTKDLEVDCTSLIGVKI